MSITIDENITPELTSTSIQKDHLETNAYIRLTKHIDRPCMHCKQPTVFEFDFYESPEAEHPINLNLKNPKCFNTSCATFDVQLHTKKFLGLITKYELKEGAMFPLSP